LEESTLGYWEESACWAFHNSTALITTTSFMVFEKSINTSLVVIVAVKKELPLSCAGLQ
jgi:hypothetical protein